MMFAALAMAQPPAPGPADQGAQDPPSRAARLSVVNGTVSFQSGSVDDWVPATLNRPLTTGDRLWTDQDGRAEVSLGSAAMRLSSRTNFSFINLDDRTAQVQLSTGTLSVRVRRLADDETVEIDTPQAALSLLRPGEYRIEVDEQGVATIVGVRSGQAEATAGQAYTIQPREQVRISGGADGSAPVFDTRDLPPADQFDLWCQDRDRREDMSVSGRYVSRDTPGYADLDQNGTWRTVPEYGTVWVPNSVPPGWAPYHYGHWAWIAPWGWTWVDDAPWGYAPFHYGRWVFIDGVWAWVPGPMPGPGVVVARPVFAPALVAWVGGVGIGVGVAGGVGWFPLGPREVFVPAYAYSPEYLERVNVTNTVIVNRAVLVNYNVAGAVYVNRGVVGGVTVVPGGVIAAGGPVAAAAIVVRPEMLGRVQVTAVAAVVPERAAVFGGGAVVTRGVPPAVVMNRTVVTRMAPPPRPVAFDRQQAMLGANPGRPLDAAATTNLQRSEPEAARPAYRPATASSTYPGAPSRSNTQHNVAMPPPGSVSSRTNSGQNEPVQAHPPAANQTPSERSTGATKQERNKKQQTKTSREEKKEHP